jgi:hypothetical protein
MPFTVEEFRDLVRIVEERPEWRGELRRLVLTDELLSLPEQVARLRQDTEKGFQELTAQVTTLAAQVTTLTAQVAELTRAVHTLTDDVGELKGKSLEADYRTKVFAYFGRLLRRAHVLSPEELTALLEGAIDSGTLSAAQAQEIALADLVVRGRRQGDGAEVYLVVEVSWGVGPDDVERAVRRAELFARTGTTAIPVVAGKRVTADAARLARMEKVWQLTDGHAVLPELAATPS